MIINQRIILILFLWFVLVRLITEAAQVNLADIRNQTYFGEFSNEPVDDIVNADDFDYGVGDFLFYYARAREFAKKMQYSDGIKELDKALKYCYQNEDKAYVLSFRALLNIFLINKQPVHIVYAIDDYTHAYSLTKNSQELFNRAKLKVMVGNYQSALSDIEIIIKNCSALADKQMLTDHNFANQSLKELSYAKLKYLKNYPCYFQAMILKGFIYYQFLYDYDGAIKHYSKGIGFLEESDFKGWSLEFNALMLEKDPRVLNNLAMSYLMRGQVEDLDSAIYLLEFAKKQDPSNIIFKETELLYHICRNELSSAQTVYQAIIDELKISSKMEAEMNDFISLIYDYDNNNVILKMVEKLFIFSSSSVKLKNFISTLAEMPNLLVAGYVASEVKLLKTNDQLTDINLKDSLRNKYQLEIDLKAVNEIISLPSLYSFSHGYISSQDFAKTIAMKISLYKKKKIQYMQIAPFLEFIEKYYGRSFFVFFTRILNIKHGISHKDFMQNVFHAIKIHNSEMIKRQEELDKLKKKVLKS